MKSKLRGNKITILKSNLNPCATEDPACGKPQQILTATTAMANTTS
jgi:hypothetical protein